MEEDVTINQVRMNVINFALGVRNLYGFFNRIEENYLIQITHFDEFEMTIYFTHYLDRILFSKLKKFILSLNTH